MLSRIGERVARRLDGPSPWTDVYGLARSLLALATAATLASNHSAVLFHPVVGSDGIPHCAGVARLGLFCHPPFASLEWARWLGVGILLVVASGWRPRVTALFHWWVTFSFQAGASIVDGGDQAAAVLTLLLLPVAWGDPRRWHWRVPREEEPGAGGELARLVALTARPWVRLQVAAIYLYAAVAKLGVPEWREGTALYYWLGNPVFGASEPLRSLLTPLLAHPVAVSLLTWGVLILELALFLALVGSPAYRRGAFVAGVLFHLAIAAVQGLPTFSLVMISALILYLLPWQCPLGAGLARWLEGAPGRGRRLARALVWLTPGPATRSARSSWR